jgi:hypothetical protein
MEDYIEHMSQMNCSTDTDARVGHKTADSSFFGYKTHIAMKLYLHITHGTLAKEDEFEFNRDVGMFLCKAGHMAIKKKFEERKGQDKNPIIKFFFDIEKCKGCPFNEGCSKEGEKSKTYSITVKSTDHKDQEAFQETERFSHLFGMEIQGATAIFAVNLKRILKLLMKKSKKRQGKR